MTTKTATTAGMAYKLQGMTMLLPLGFRRVAVVKCCSDVCVSLREVVVIRGRWVVRTSSPIVGDSIHKIRCKESIICNSNWLYRLWTYYKNPACLHRTFATHAASLHTLPDTWFCPILGRPAFVLILVHITTNGTEILRLINNFMIWMIKCTSIHACKVFFLSFY